MLICDKRGSGIQTLLADGGLHSLQFNFLFVVITDGPSEFITAMHTHAHTARFPSLLGQRPALLVLLCKVLKEKASAWSQRAGFPLFPLLHAPAVWPWDVYFIFPCLVFSAAKWV